MHNVDRQLDLPDFGPWRHKQGSVAVQPPRETLETICTLRIHLDECDATNGALKIVPGSHQHGAICKKLVDETRQNLTAPGPGDEANH